MNSQQKERVLDGEQFIELLLERLAAEESLSRRRILMDRIREFGPLARDAMIARLRDRRWFFLRNLVIMLRQLDDITVLEHVRPLLHDANQRVRQEALRTCLHFHDTSAEQHLLQDLDSSDRETQLAAISMAGMSSSADVFRKLLAFISSPGFSVIECELKSSAVHALAEIGKPDALPELDKLLAAKSLLYSGPLTRLKVDIVRSLGRYPEAGALPILAKAAAGRGEVARQARHALNLRAEKSSAPWP